MQQTQYPPLFATTHWSVVLAARDTASPEADAALAELCRIYSFLSKIRAAQVSPPQLF
jgi:hypothetical protein